MSSHTLRPALSAAPASAPRAARHALRLLGRLTHGTLHLQCPDESTVVLGTGGAPHASVRLRDWRVFADVLSRGDVGFGEAYVDGRWSSPDLPALLRLVLANREALDGAIRGRWWGGLWSRLRHALNRNTRRGSRRNIAAHYDLGNDFYRLWLDETLNYSSAWFDGDRTRPLADAQRAKMRRALDECRLTPGQRLLEIGCGWGAVAELAAGERRAQVTGLTLSREQLALARERLARQGLTADLRLQDWRDAPEEGFDAIVSIEMFEAVGRAYWGDFFRRVHAQLKPGGRACIQTITIRDDLFARYLKGTDFIQQHVFPGGVLPSASVFQAEAEAAGLRMVNRMDFGTDYGETLRQWRRTFLQRAPDLQRLGLDDRFGRLWDFYLAYCEAAFDQGSTGVSQFTLQRR